MVKTRKGCSIIECLKEEMRNFLISFSMDKEQLFKFVNNYKKNDLNPFQFELGYQKENEEKYEKEE